MCRYNVAISVTNGTMAVYVDGALVRTGIATRAGLSIAQLDFAGGLDLFRVFVVDNISYCLKRGKRD